MQRRAELTRERVLDAAADVFARRGFVASSMSEIIEAADVTKGAVYFHFASKDALALAVVQAQYERWPPIIREITEAAPDPLTAIVALTYEVGRRLSDDVIVRAGVRLAVERHNVGVELPTPFTGWCAAFEELLEEAAAAGWLREGLSPIETARTIVGSIFGIQHMSWVLYDRKDLQQRLDEFWELAIHGIGARESDTNETLRAAHALFESS